MNEKVNEKNNTHVLNYRFEIIENTPCAYLRPRAQRRKILKPGKRVEMKVEHCFHFFLSLYRFSLIWGYGGREGVARKPFHDGECEPSNRILEYHYCSY